MLLAICRICFLLWRRGFAAGQALVFKWSIDDIKWDTSHGDFYAVMCGGKGILKS